MISKLNHVQRLYPLIALLLIWPAVLNGSPFFFSDTTAYIRGGDGAVLLLTNRSTKWSTTILSHQTSEPQAKGGASPAADAEAPTAQGAAPPSSSFNKNVLMGRSIYYGLFLYAGPALDNFWLPILAQALIAGMVLLGAARHVVDPANHRGRFAAVFFGMFAITLFTPLPYFTSFLMPDLFTGLAIVAAITLVFGWSRERRAWRLFWFALLGASALYHSTNLLILILLTVAALALALLSKRPLPWQAAAVMVAAVVIGIAGDAAFSAAVHKAIGRSPIRPPFLAARLIADGPGAAYLKENCPGAGFVLCRYRANFPMHADQFLWESTPGVFTAVSGETQRQIVEEERRFVFAVIARYPFWTLQTALANGTHQLFDSSLSDFNGPAFTSSRISQKIPDPTAGYITRSLANRALMPVWIYNGYAVPLIIASLLVLVGVFAFAPGKAWRQPVILALIAIVANAGTCGALSGPHSRYQDRVIWLIPAMAAAVLLSRRWGREAAGDTPFQGAAR